jgi:hypothetical protein
MTTAITATLLTVPPVIERIRCKRAEFTLALPTEWTAAGIAIDLSSSANGSFTYISRWHFSGLLVTDYAIIMNLIGTEGTGVHEGNLSASTCKVVAYQAPAKTGNAEAATMVLASVADSANHSALTCYLKVWGY